MCAMDVREKQKPQDGRMLLGPLEGGAVIDIRVCVLPACIGESVTMRLLSRDEVKLSLDRLGFAPSNRARLDRALAAPNGLIVVAGPMGSGKTTTLYSCLTQVTKPGLKVLTVEDPVEFLLPGMTQVQINHSVATPFAYALRAVLRSDPDVVMVGELRDLPSLEMTLITAITGHLVMTTLHTDDCASTLKRLLDMGGEPFVVASALRLVVCQRLVRVLCPDCSAPAEPPANMLAQAEQIARTGGLGWDGLPRKFRKPVGCPKCGKHGYRCRVTISEMLEMSGEIGSALRRRASEDEMRTIAIGQGMTTLAADGVRLAAESRTTLEEVFRVVPARVPG
jgi:type II secretory ATPase GspE/PulE/Tfp pilus assembly ATPase PilB-like protein